MEPHYVAEHQSSTQFSSEANARSNKVGNRSSYFNDSPARQPLVTQQQPPHQVHGGTLQNNQAHVYLGHSNSQQNFRMAWKKTTYGIAVAQIILGFLMLALEIASCTCAFRENSNSDFEYRFSICFFSGIYGGILYIVTGSLGVSSSSRNSKCLLVSTLVLSSVSAFIALTANIISFVFSIYFSMEFYYDSYHSRDGPSDLILVVLSLNSIMLVITIAQIVLFITQSVFAGVVCCMNSNFIIPQSYSSNVAPYQVVPINSEQQDQQQRLPTETTTVPNNGSVHVNQGRFNQGYIIKEEGHDEG